MHSTFAGEMKSPLSTLRILSLALHHSQKLLWCHLSELLGPNGLLLPSHCSLFGWFLESEIECSANLLQGY
jgi:hypothetical protein